MLPAWKIGRAADTSQSSCWHYYESTQLRLSLKTAGVILIQARCTPFQCQNSIYYESTQLRLSLKTAGVILIQARYTPFQCQNSMCIWAVTASSNNTHTHTTILWPFFWDHPGQPVPEENFWTLWCNGRLTEADTLTIRLGATPSGLTSAHLHHPHGMVM